MNAQFEFKCPAYLYHVLLHIRCSIMEMAASWNMQHHGEYIIVKDATAWNIEYGTK